EEPKKEEEMQKPAEKKVKEAPAFTQPAFVPEPPLVREEKVLRAAEEERIHASPLARSLAKSKGLDLSTVKGSGPGGRITSKDLEDAQPAGLVTFGRQEEPDVPAGTYEEIPLSPVRKIIARRLQESKSFIPHFYIKQVINAEPLAQLRDQLKHFNLKV